MLVPVPNVRISGWQIPLVLMVAFAGIGGFIAVENQHEDQLPLIAVACGAVGFLLGVLAMWLDKPRAETQPELPTLVDGIEYEFVAGEEPSPFLTRSLALLAFMTFWLPGFGLILAIWAYFANRAYGGWPLKLAKIAIWLGLIINLIVAAVVIGVNLTEKPRR